ncbi:MAG TPA: hypothetical protein PK402_07030, partial [Tepidisphaeraceae bacterium]|nr:hypothetical protein [Tepidisphaeraceae bacterium]
MAKYLPILAAWLTILALPFIFQQKPPAGDWKNGDPVLVIVSPHSEATRHEFALGFSKWHKE